MVSRRGAGQFGFTKNKQGNIKRGSPCGVSLVAELRAREEEIAREWQWLHDALNAVARLRAEQGDAQAFQLMQQQTMRVGQRRVELRMKLAALERR